MADDKPMTAAANGPLWGARARDWADLQEQTARPGFVAVLDHCEVGPGTALLDLGCGSGMAARLAADRGAAVAGIDAAGPLLAIARERVPNGDFREGELEELPFADASFDVVTAFNAVQYAARPASALAEARRVTRPGGRVAVMIWGEPAGMPMAGVIGALKPLLPAPPPGAPGPFALSGEAALRALADAAGLRVEAIEDVDAPFVYPDRPTAIRALNSSGVAARAIAAAGEDAVSAAHGAAIDPFVQPDGSYRIGATFRCLYVRA